MLHRLVLLILGRLPYLGLRLRGVLSEELPGMIAIYCTGIAQTRSALGLPRKCDDDVVVLP